MYNIEKHKYNIAEKQIRSSVIETYLISTGQPAEAVIFSCGNASKCLAEKNIKVTQVNNPARWYSYTEIYQKYKIFDATSGHLPFPLMLLIAALLKEQFPELKKESHLVLPTGSGETLVCLKIAFPHLQITAIYNENKNTQYNKRAPLNNIVKLLSYLIIK